MTFQPASVLFDKGVIRRIYECSVRLTRDAAPTLPQLAAVEVFGRLCLLSNQRYVTEQTANILNRRPRRFARPILNDVQVLRKGHYLRRWARLRALAFSPEDAVMLAYASFGVTSNRSPVGIEILVTADFKMAANFHDQRAEIETRFERMTRSLPEPYQSLPLPAALTTAAVLILT